MQDLPLRLLSAEESGTWVLDLFQLGPTWMRSGPWRAAASEVQGLMETQPLWGNQ